MANDDLKVPVPPWQAAKQAKRDAKAAWDPTVYRLVTPGESAERAAADAARQAGVAEPACDGGGLECLRRVAGLRGHTPACRVAKLRAVRGA